MSLDARRSLYLPECARDDWIMQRAAVGGADLPRLTAATLPRPPFTDEDASALADRVYDHAWQQSLRDQRSPAGRYISGTG